MVSPIRFGIQIIFFVELLTATFGPVMICPVTLVPDATSTLRATPPTKLSPEIPPCFPDFLIPSIPIENCWFLKSADFFARNSSVYAPAGSALSANMPLESVLTCFMILPPAFSFTVMSTVGTFEPSTTGQATPMIRRKTMFCARVFMAKPYSRLPHFQDKSNPNVHLHFGEVYNLNQSVLADLANISTRGFVDTNDNVMIGGFISGNHLTTVLVRAIGPSLGAFGIPNFLPDPTLELHDANGALLISNDNWQDDPVSAAQLTANGLAPQNNLESGIFTTLPPGAFTAILAGKNGTTGIGLVEIYNLK
jgi:hypothetical protein